ncbi:collagen-like triple helix repeat-containing protein, partial [Lacrimispora algidixylanolytica]|uniref:collagen-like triple helix repeat-containing protein n=1 Tax=Lacrimispora algidixylanolytica TaxID=94868 RepID=UPI001407333C
MSDIAMQLDLILSNEVEVGSNVLFDTISYSSGNINYNPSTGTVTFQETGRYIINWWLATQSSQSTNGIAFALSSSQGDLLVGNSPIKTSEVYGIGIIEVLSTPVTLSLINVSTNTVFFSMLVPLKGSLTIVEDDVQGSSGPTGDTGPTGNTGPTGATGPT